MKIAPNHMFHTPASMTELQDMAEQYHGTERVAFTMGMALAWNLAAKIAAGNAEDDTPVKGG